MNLKGRANIMPCLIKKMIMKKTELILLVICFISLLLRYFSIPGSLMLMVFSFSIISMIYFPFGFYFFNIKTGDKPIISSLIFGFILSITTVSLLFNIADWPVMEPIHLMASIGAAISVPYYLYNWLKSGEQKLYFRNLFLRQIIIGFFATFTYFH